MFKDEQLKSTCNKLVPFIGKAKAQSLWLAYITSETMQAKAEAQTFIELFWLRFAGPSVDNNTIYLPADSNFSKGSIPFGTVCYGQAPIGELRLKPEDINKHIGLFSITGGGKTNACKLMLSTLAHSYPFLVIDWKRSYRDLAYISKTHIDIVSIGQEGKQNLEWNPLQPPPGTGYQAWMYIVAELLEKSHLSGPGTADVLIEVFDRLFTKNGWANSGQKVKRLPTFKQALFEVQSGQFTGRRMLWRDTCVRILRTFTLGSAAKTFNTMAPASLEKLLSTPTILEIDFELPKPIRVFISELILRWVHLYRLRQGESKTLRHVLIFEEAHNMMPTHRNDTQMHSLETLLREIRGFGQGLVLISQHPSLLPTYVLGNTNTLVFLGLQHEDDIRAAAKALFLPKEDMHYLDKLKVGEALVKIKSRGGPYYVRFPEVA